MMKHYTLRAAALAGVCMLPLAAVAQEAEQYNSEVDLGVRGQTSTSPVYGRYNGFVKDGAQFLGGFSLNGGDAWDSGGTTYYHLQGTNLDYTSDKVAPEGTVSLKLGNQGRWGVNAYYDAITYTGEQFYSAFTPANHGVLGLQPGFPRFGGASATSGTGAVTSLATTGAAGTFNPLHSLFQQQTAGTRRDIVGGDVKFIFGDWTFTTGVKQEHKQGSVLDTFDQSTSGLAFGLPVDFDTIRYTAQMAFNSRRLQALLGYTFSGFDDANTSTIAPYFLAGTATSASSVGFQKYSAYENPPSNQAHYLNGSLGFDVNDYSRVMANARAGVEMQNGALGNGTGTPLTAVDGANILASNPNTAGLAAQVYAGNITATSQPMLHLTLRGSYSFDERKADWRNPIAGAAGQSESVPVPANAFSVGQSWTKQQGMLEAGYRILPSTKLTVGYIFDKTDRDLSYVTHSNTNTVSVKLASQPLANLSGWVSYEYSDRSGGQQVTYVAPTATTGVQTSSEVTQFNSNLGFLAIPWYQAPSHTNTVKLRSDYQVGEAVDLGVTGKLAEHDYQYIPGFVGLARNYTAEAGPDLSYTPNKRLAAHLFYSYEEIYYGDRGASPAYDVNGFYGTSAPSTDHIHTVGLSADWKATEKLKFGASYTFYYGDLNYNLFDGVTTATSGLNSSQISNIQNVPGINSSMHSVKLRASYQLAPNMDWMVGYTYDMFKDNDWAFNTFSNVGASNLNGGVYVTDGEVNPSYHVHSLYTEVKVRF